MLVMILSKTPASLRGELTRWLMEVESGVYIGHVSAMVRDRLWDYSCASKNAGRVFQAWSTNNEQHYKMRLAGFEDMRVVEWEGLQLIQKVKDELTQPQRKRVRKT